MMLMMMLQMVNHLWNCKTKMTGNAEVRPLQLLVCPAGGDQPP